MTHRRARAAKSETRGISKVESSAHRSNGLSVTRRLFLKKAGIAGLGAAAVYVAPQFSTTRSKRAYAGISGATPELQATPWNVAAGVTAITSSYPIYSAPLAALTDGVTKSEPYLDMPGGTPKWLEIDLGAQFDILGLNVRHYYRDGRTYHDVILQLSSDGSAWQNVFNNDSDNSSAQGTGSDAEYAETSAGKDVVLSTPVQARYVRSWTNGSTANAANHHVELEVYGISG